MEVLGAPSRRGGGDDRSWGVSPSLAYLRCDGIGLVRVVNVLFLAVGGDADRLGFLPGFSRAQEIESGFGLFVSCYLFVSKSLVRHREPFHLSLSKNACVDGDHGRDLFDLSEPHHLEIYPLIDRYAFYRRARIVNDDHCPIAFPDRAWILLFHLAYRQRREYLLNHRF